MIPHNTKGKATDLKNEVVLHSREDAANYFVRAYKRLLNPPLWHELAGIASASFLLYGPDGKLAQRLVQPMDHFRIDIPGPGNAEGSGYDWVRVEAVKYFADALKDEESMTLMVCPSPNPTTDGSDTAHFFQGEASSTFVIRRVNTTVTASYHGRNEVPNTHTEKLTDNVRNAAVAIGAFVGFSELQWGSLISGFLKEEIGG